MRRRRTAPSVVPSAESKKKPSEPSSAGVTHADRSANATEAQEAEHFQSGGATDGNGLGVDRPATGKQTDAGTPLEITSENVRALWDQALAEMGGIFAQMAACCDRIAIPAPNSLVVHFPEKYTSFKTTCERPENLGRLEQALQRVSGCRVKLEFAVSGSAAEAAPPSVPQRSRGSASRLAEKSQHPLVQRAVELFGAEPVWVDESQS
jgi:hypothetical protein